MKKKVLFIALSVFAVVAAVALLLYSAKDTDDPQSKYPAVQVLEKTSTAEESSYRIGVTLPASDLSTIGQQLSDVIDQEWTTYNSMTEIQRLTSSQAWGIVYIQTDTWSECEQAIGFAVDNPLESFDWLNKTDHLGMDRTSPFSPPASTVKHIQIIANTQATDRAVNSIRLTAGYNIEDIRVTLSAALISNENEEVHTTRGRICNGYATYEEVSTTTGTGIPVLIVITNEANNNGYYNKNYFDPTAYWVKDNVFYTLRLVGDETNKDAVQAALERIIEEI